MASFELNQIAQHHHDGIINQRIAAINNTLSKLIQEAHVALATIDRSETKDNSAIVDLKASIADVLKIANGEVARIKREISIIRQCNYCFLKIQPIIGEDDLRRYSDFLIMTYKKVTKDVTKFCVVCELNIEQFINIPSRLREIASRESKKRKPAKKASYVPSIGKISLILLMKLCSYPVMYM